MSTVAPPEDDLQVPIPELLGKLLEANGSDLHLTAGTPPTVRVHGELERLEDYPPLTPRALQGMIYAILTQKQRESFEQELELDMSLLAARPGPVPRQRLPAARRGRRGVPGDPVRDQEARGPRVCRRSRPTSRRFPRGFVLVTGPTGSGKSTTLAAMVDIVNRERADHIMTVEDPIEFLHQHKSCVVNQREVGEDTHCFAARPQARAAPGPRRHPGRRDA